MSVNVVPQTLKCTAAFLVKTISLIARTTRKASVTIKSFFLLLENKISGIVAESSDLPPPGGVN